MNPAPIKGATRVLGEKQGYVPLPIRDAVIENTVGDSVEQSPCMVTEWTPSLEELSAIMGGARIRVTIIGTAHPPIMVGVSNES